MLKAPIYGKVSDVGELDIRAKIRLTRGGLVALTVEMWSTRPVFVDGEARRCHAVEAILSEPVGASSYAKAYSDVLVAYMDYWKALGADVPRDWQHGLAQACGVAMQRYEAHKN